MFGLYILSGTTRAPLAQVDDFHRARDLTQRWSRHTDYEIALTTPEEAEPILVYRRGREVFSRPFKSN